MPNDTRSAKPTLDDNVTDFDSLMTFYDRNSGTPSGVVAATAFVRDTMRLAKAAAASLGAGSPSDDMVLAVYDRIVLRMASRMGKP